MVRITPLQLRRLSRRGRGPLRLRAQVQCMSRHALHVRQAGDVRQKRPGALLSPLRTFRSEVLHACSGRVDVAFNEATRGTASFCLNRTLRSTSEDELSRSAVSFEAPPRRSPPVPSNASSSRLLLPLQSNEVRPGPCLAVCFAAVQPLGPGFLAPLPTVLAADVAKFLGSMVKSRWAFVSKVRSRLLRRHTPGSLSSFSGRRLARREAAARKGFRAERLPCFRAERLPRREASA